MNIACQSQTSDRWIAEIQWCRLEDVSQECTLLQDTTVAFMFDLCLKRLSRRARSPEDDPHISIGNVLLDSSRMPSLRHFISTYEPSIMTKRSLCGNTWRLVGQRNLPCSTNSYTFYVYQRCSVMNNE
jgi:hypothetical protein